MPAFSTIGSGSTGGCNILGTVWDQEIIVPMVMRSPPLDLLLACWVTWAKSHPHSVPLLPHLLNEDNDAALFAKVICDVLMKSTR